MSEQDRKDSSAEFLEIIEKADQALANPDISDDERKRQEQIKRQAIDALKGLEPKWE